MKFRLRNIACTLGLLATSTQFSAWAEYPDVLYSAMLLDGQCNPTVATLIAQAQQGDAESQYILGLAKLSGTCMPKNEHEAVAWYRKAADQGDIRAQFNLAEAYENGKGVAKSDRKAAIWYRKAAEQGYSSGQYALGLMCENGRGVAKNDNEAMSWYRKAAEQGHADAAKERDALSQRMGQVKVNPTLRASPTSGPVDTPVSSNYPYPPRPAARPGVVTCSTRCNNGDCYRSYGDGRKVHFQARQKFNPLTNQFEFDSGGC